MRPCFCCDNVWSLDSDLASRGRDQIEIDACRRDSFRLKSQSVLFGQVDDILNAIDGVKRGERGSTTRLKELGMAFGSNVTEHGLLTMPALRRSGMHPVDMVRHDWVHNSLQRGVFQMEIALFFESTGIDDVTGQYNRFLSLEWNVHPELAPSFRKLSEICMSQDVRGLERPLAAQVIGFFRIFRFFVATLPGEPDLPASSLIACCSLIEAFLDAKYWRRVFGSRMSRRHAITTAARNIRQRWESHMQAHRRAYGPGRVIPKHHWAGHGADALEADGDMADCLVVERLHIRVREAARLVDNTKVIEAATCTRIFALHADSHVAVPAVGGRVQIEDACQVADWLDFDGQHYRSGHFVVDEDLVPHKLGFVTKRLDSDVFRVVVEKHVVIERHPQWVKCRPLGVAEHMIPGQELVPQFKHD